MQGLAILKFLFLPFLIGTTCVHVFAPSLSVVFRSEVAVASLGSHSRRSFRCAAPGSTRQPCDGVKLRLLFEFFECLELSLLPIRNRMTHEQPAAVFHPEPRRGGCAFRAVAV